MAVDRMHHHPRVAHRLSVVVLQHHKAQCRHRNIVLRLLIARVASDRRDPGNPHGPRDEHHQRDLFHGTDNLIPNIKLTSTYECKLLSINKLPDQQAVGLTTTNYSLYT